MEEWLQGDSQEVERMERRERELEKQIGDLESEVKGLKEGLARVNL